MRVELSPIKWRFALFYLHGIVVFSFSVAEHIDHVEHALNL